jgi:hypothetical protein
VPTIIERDETFTRNKLHNAALHTVLLNRPEIFNLQHSLSSKKCWLAAYHLTKAANQTWVSQPATGEKS